MYDAILIHTGVNDIRRHSAEKASTDYVSAIKAIAGKKNHKIIVSSILPAAQPGQQVKRELYNALVKSQLYDMEEVSFLDHDSINPAMHLRDEVHPNERGTSVLAGNIGRNVNRALWTTAKRQRSGANRRTHGQRKDHFTSPAMERNRPQTEFNTKAPPTERYRRWGEDQRYNDRYCQINPEQYPRDQTRQRRANQYHWNKKQDHRNESHKFGMRHDMPSEDDNSHKVYGTNGRDTENIDRFYKKRIARTNVSRFSYKYGYQRPGHHGRVGYTHEWNEGHDNYRNSEVNANDRENGKNRHWGFNQDYGQGNYSGSRHFSAGNFLPRSNRENYEQREMRSHQGKDDNDHYPEYRYNRNPRRQYNTPYRR
jgi:hypothetical protein